MGWIQKLLVSSKQEPVATDARPGLHTPAPWVEIPLSDGKHFAKIDVEDFPLIARYKWHAQIASNGKYLYAGCNITKDAARELGIAVRDTSDQNHRNVQWTRTTLHQILLGKKSGMMIDHANRDGLDCRRSNMRWATSVQNSQNRAGRPNVTSAFKGVSWWAQQQRWRAQIRQTHLGRFRSEIEAAVAYDIAARQLYGDFAVLNFS